MHNAGWTGSHRYYDKNIEVRHTASHRTTNGDIAGDVGVSLETTKWHAYHRSEPSCKSGA